MALDPLGLGEGDAEGILAVCERWLWALLESDMAEWELARQWECCARNTWPEHTRDPERRGQGLRAERAAGVRTQARQRSSIGWAHECGGVPTGVAVVEQMRCIKEERGRRRNGCLRCWGLAAAVGICPWYRFRACAGAVWWVPEGSCRGSCWGAPGRP